MPRAEFGPHVSPVNVKDAYGDKASVHVSEYDRIWLKATDGVATALMGFTPKQARRLAKTLKRAAKAADRL